MPPTAYLVLHIYCIAKQGKGQNRGIQTESLIISVPVTLSHMPLTKLNHEEEEFLNKKNSISKEFTVSWLKFYWNIYYIA